MARISELKCLLLQFVFLLTSLLETGVKGSTHNFCTNWNKTQFMLQHFTLKTDKSYSTWIHMNTLNECCESSNHGNEWYNVNGCDITECIILMSLTSVKRRPPSRSDTKKIVVCTFPYSSWVTPVLRHIKLKLTHSLSSDSTCTTFYGIFTSINIYSSLLVLQWKHSHKSWKTKLMMTDNSNWIKIKDPPSTPSLPKKLFHSCGTWTCWISVMLSPLSIILPETHQWKQ